MKAFALLSIGLPSVLCWGCGSEPETPAQHIQEVQTQLNDGDLEATEAAVDVALAEIDSTSGAGLELQGQKLEAMARRKISKEVQDEDPESRSRHTAAVTDFLKQLHTGHPDQFGYEDFLVVGAWLAEAGDCSGAVDLLAYADETLEGHSAIFEEAVLSAGGVCGGGDDDLLQQLQSLGYI